MAEIVYVNGNIFTQNENMPKATAVASDKGIIVAVGQYEDIRAHITENTEVVDFNEKFVFPGFIESESTYMDEEDLTDKGFTSIAYDAYGQLNPEECTRIRFLDSPCIKRNGIKFGNCDMAIDAIAQLTVTAAEELKRDDIGIIEVGRVADFTVFEENPIGKNLRYFTNMHAEQTIIGGRIVYDAEEALMDEMYLMMTEMLV